MFFKVLIWLMHCFDEKAWFLPRSQLCCLSPLLCGIRCLMRREIRCQSYWASLACNEWFSHVYIGALNGAHILLRLSIFLQSFSLCSLGCIISINQSSSYRFFLPSVGIYCGVPLGNVSFHIPTSLSLFDGTWSWYLLHFFLGGCFTFAGQL